MDSSIKLDTDALRKAVLDLLHGQLDPLVYSQGIIRDHAPAHIRDHPYCDSYRPQASDWIANADAKMVTLVTALQESADRLQAIVDFFEAIDGESQESWDVIAQQNPGLLGNRDLMAMIVLGMTLDQIKALLEYGSLLQSQPGIDVAMLLSVLQTAMYAQFFPASVSDQAAKFIGKFEKYDGFIVKPTDKLDGQCTAGYGHVLHHGKCTKEDLALVVDEKMAVEWMKQDLANSERTIREYVRVPLSQQQYDALVSAVYNAGSYIFKDSETGEPTQLLIDLNNGNYSAAAKDLLAFHYTKDPQTQMYVSLDGLVRRRKEEKEMWEDGNYTIDSASKWK
jgi:GH24 family phage-related lysozyme (muramidase)